MAYPTQRLDRLRALAKVGDAHAKLVGELDFGEALLILLGGGGIVAGTKRVRRGLGVGVELERGEEPFDVSGLITGYR